jgi:uracil-DNA glycosylase family 4
MSKELLEKKGPKQNDILLEIYYDYLYKARADWVKYGIPVSFKDPRSGFIVEGLLYAPAKRTVSSRAFKVNVKYAFDTPRVANIVAVNALDIYPSNRRITKVETGKVVEAVVVPDFKDLRIKSPIEFTKIKDIYDSYHGVNWTANELCSILDRPSTDIEKIQNLPFLQKVSQRVCKITGELSDTWGLQTPEEMKEKENKNKWSLERLHTEYTGCTKCALGMKRKARGCDVVHGRGSETPKIFIVGEAPGMQEEKTGITFYQEAPAGGVLFKVMSAVNIPQSDCYITNSVLCRPEPDTGANTQNGKPEQEHIAACSSRLKMELLITGAKVIVLLGAYAYRSFFGMPVKGRMDDHVGWQDYTKGDYKVYLTYHPSFVIRKLSFEQDPEVVAKIKNDYKADFMEIRKAVYGN